MIEFRHVIKRYDDSPVLNDVSLEVKDGEFFVLVGPSGGGKTTMLKMVNRLVEPDDGAVLVDGQDIAGQDMRRLRLSIGYVLQQGALFPNLTVAQNAALIPELNGWAPDKRTARVRDLLRQVDLDPDDYMDRLPEQLSGGEQQRVGIVRALAANPRIVLMDEPFSALDPIVRAQLQDLIKRLQHGTGTTVLFVTHDIDEALLLADRIAVIHDGSIAQVGSPAQVTDAPADGFVREFFAHRATDHAADRATDHATKHAVDHAAGHAGRTGRTSQDTGPAARRRPDHRGRL
ncbi:ABC transporter ATP-binding protein [Bifidobacterium choloepi]|uniref:ABC-type quaternary amine transporter n=1 Tax=Bifidobacterium choloepi TaxID=2614131 RepID=A0A6I5MZ43_9BIFI|nr:ABC transporter ATP-binding protein [Bifidobacterium choloepi]NEG69918.1 ABC transporter ATP-binding protein [Bifidobacterium choloepi]